MTLGASVNLASPVNRACPLNRGLVSWWLPVPGAPRGLRLLDLAGGAHATLVNGALWHTPPPLHFGAIELDGTDDYLDAGAAALAKVTTEVSVTAWIRPRAITSNKYRVIDAGDGSGSVSIAFKGSTSASGDLLAGVDVGGGFTFSTSSGTPIVQDAWQMVGMSWQSGDYTHLYVNGAEIAYGSAPTITGTMVQPSGYVNFGRVWLGGTILYSQMTITDVRLYNRHVDAGEMAALYQESRLGYPTALAWRRRGAARSVAAAAAAAHLLPLLGVGG